MKTTLLLPNGFKKIGWAIFVPAFLLGCSICFFGENFDRWLFRETVMNNICLLYTSPSPRDVEESRMPSSA